jgi:hypothetical protein
MRWKLTLLGVATAALLFLLIAPIKTIKIVVEFPTSAVRPIPAHEVAPWVTYGVYAVIVLTILAAAAWIAWRIVKSNRP